MADPTSLKFHYIKSPMARELHVSGVYGGINANSGDFHVSVFAERPAIPQVISFVLEDGGTLGPELPDGREGKEGMVRVIEDTLHMDFATALAVHRWLGNHIDRYLKEHPEIVVEETKPPKETP